MFSRLRNLLANKKIIHLNDSYIQWLSFANAGMLHKGNVYCFEHAIKNLPSGDPVLEIGSFCGLSTNIISYLLRKHKKQNKIITCDKWVFEGTSPNGIGNGIHFSEYSLFVKETFKRNVHFFGRENLPYTVEAYSDDFFEMWRGEASIKDIFDRDLPIGSKFSFAYIDGNHSYDYCKRDFENADKYLEKGGFILFDDSSDGSHFESALFMKEVLNNSNYELVIKNPNYLFKKLV
jgi:hypothetical protein